MMNRFADERLVGRLVDWEQTVELENKSSNEEQNLIQIQDISYDADEFDFSEKSAASDVSRKKHVLFAAESDEESERKNLNFERQKTKIVTKIHSPLKKHTIEFYKKINEWESLNYMDSLRTSMTGVDFDKISKHLKSFYDKRDSEQCCIFIHNINIAKHKFDFNSFLSKNEAASALFDEEILKSYKINSKVMTAELLNVDTYRKIIKEKEKIEGRYRKELKYKQINGRRLRRVQAETSKERSRERKQRVAANFTEGNGNDGEDD